MFTNVICSSRAVIHYPTFAFISFFNFCGFVIGAMNPVPTHFQYQNEEKKLAQVTRSFFLKKEALDGCNSLLIKYTENREEQLKNTLNMIHV